MQSRHRLYLVAVPIGNLEEITFLGFRILRDTKCIFCEDTRVTRKLLELLDIWRNQELIKLNQFNERESLRAVEDRLGSEDCVLVSDAGYPIISDPGHFLVMHLREKGFNIQVVNGPCAFVHAIVASGIDARKIFFASFLTKKYLQRKRELERLRSVLAMSTVIYYESKNFLIRGLEILQEVYGDIKIGALKELSKLNEAWYYDRVSRIRESLVVKGEFVIIIPRQKEQEEDADVEGVLEAMHQRMASGGVKLKQVCKEFEHPSLNSKSLYRLYIEKYRREN